jgi:hypothetical protein
VDAQQRLCRAVVHGPGPELHPPAAGPGLDRAHLHLTVRSRSPIHQTTPDEASSTCAKMWTGPDEEQMPARGLSRRLARNRLARHRTGSTRTPPRTRSRPTRELGPEVDPSSTTPSRRLALATSSTDAAVPRTAGGLSSRNDRAQDVTTMTLDQLRRTLNRNTGRCAALATVGHSKMASTTSATKYPVETPTKPAIRAPTPARTS